MKIRISGKIYDAVSGVVPPKEAESRYKTGGYMIWIDGKIKRCVRDTAYSPDDDASAWEDYTAA